MYTSLEAQSAIKKALEAEHIAALRLWVKVSGVEQKNQVNVVKYNAYQNSPEFFEELDSKFADSLSDKEDGVEQIIKYLEEKLA